MPTCVRRVILFCVPMFFACAGAVYAAGYMTAAPPRACGTIAFAPNTEWGAYKITGRNTSCHTARRVARASRNLSVTRGPYSYRALGFTCRGSYDDAGLPMVHWRCSRGSVRVTFDRA